MENTNQTQPSQECAPPNFPGNPAGGPEAEALQENLRVVDDSMAMLRTILLGISMQYRSLCAQREQLLLPDGAALCGPLPKDIQAAASLIIIYALLGFQHQAERLACLEAKDGGVPDFTDVKLGATVLLVALIRLIRLTLCAPQTGPGPEGEAAELTELEEQASPAF